MEKRIAKVLEDLYRLDPALRDREEEMKKLIGKMLEERPNARMDGRFRKELKARLLERFPPMKKKSPFLSFVMRPSFALPFGAAAAACLVVILALRVGMGQGGHGIVNSEVPSTAEYQYQGSPADERAGDLDAAMRGRDNMAQTSTEGGKKTAKDGPDDALIQPLGAIPPEGMSQGVPSGQGRAELPAAAEGYSSDAKALAPPSTLTRSRSIDKEKGEAFEQDESILAGIQDVERPFNTEGYDRIAENPFLETMKEPLSTFSIDVDTASYANVRRYLNSGMLPPADAVRIEELVNYFGYSYPEPSGDAPMAWSTEMGTCPWQEGHYLLRIGLQAKDVPVDQLPPSNLVFLIDVSGSMSDANKLPLVKEALVLLVGRLRKQDRISLVVYAGAAGMVLQPTSGEEKARIMKAIGNLEAGGSTAGGEGIELAYSAAKAAFMKGGNNRVIIATDGDFNVGPSSDAEMVRLIEEKRKTGVFLTVLGFGMGNYKDSKMQKLADAGNGNYAYIDSLDEARKVLDRQMAGTLFTLAKDVKIQIEFNPARVASYRLIGYEKRLLAARDFDDDAKDAGELGAGHTVTALYQIVPASGAPVPRTDLRYQQNATTSAASSGELMVLKFRYKEPDGDVSKLIETPVSWSVAETPSLDYRFAAAVAEWGLLLRNSEHKGKADFMRVLANALPSANLQTPEGKLRAEFMRLVSQSQALMEAGTP